MKIFKSSYIQLSLALSLGLAMLSSCEDKATDYEGTLSPYITIEDVRTIYKGEDLILNNNNLSGAQKITGVVISDHSQGNLPEGLLVIQQHKKSRIRGISIQMGESAKKYQAGDSIVINVIDKKLKKDSYLYIDNVKEEDIDIIQRKKNLTLRRTTSNAIKTKSEEYESTLVSILGGEMLPKPTPETTLLGDKILQNGADSVMIVTLPTASFKGENLPRNINVTGITLGLKNNGTVKNGIFPRRLEDIVDVSDPEIPGDLGDFPIIITGFCNDPQGSDSNNEYIQFMANADIDFSVIPFSVVTSNNAGSILHTAGWASGGERTFKFNITNGKVKKGEFFYVGGTSKRINGGGSTLINQVNWVKTMSTATGAPGDGFGSSTANLLANSGNASGIALFVGTNVTEKSIPIDVVFFGGTGTASIISEDKKIGYRIGNTDRYKTYNEETGELSPFFSMGNGINDFRFLHHGGPTTTPIGYFFKLGGTFNMTHRKWLKPRERTLIVMDLVTPLATIESGEGTTIQID